ncbi:MAG: hypothetical protein WC806_04390 [Candidatus Gracilibacteria bacterium]
MRLIEIAGVECRIEDRAPVHQQGCRMTGPLNLLIATERHAGDMAKMALHRTQAHSVTIAFDCSVGCTAQRDNAGARQASDEVLRIVIAWDFPGLAGKPEAAIGEHWQMDILMVDQCRRGDLR